VAAGQLGDAPVDTNRARREVDIGPPQREQLADR
jgi:hypothetical protein